MSRNIKGYNGNNNKFTGNNAMGGNGGAKKEVENKVNNNYNKYNNMNQNQLMNELQREVMNGKMTGDLNPQVLEGFYDQMAENMTGDQLSRLRALINGIK